MFEKVIEGVNNTTALLTGEDHQLWHIIFYIILAFMVYVMYRISLHGAKKDCLENCHNEGKSLTEIVYAQRQTTWVQRIVFFILYFLLWLLLTLIRPENIEAVCMI